MSDGLPRVGSPSAPEIWLRWDSGPGEADFNMAFDEALLEAIAALARPVLRFYGWTERAATFGYFQHHAEIERLTRLRPLVRRPTGGGLVPHDADWTYSLAFPPTHPWYALRAAESYERVHAWIRDGFGRMGVATGLAAARRHDAPGQCFVGAERSDVLWHGRKVAGAAQRRNRFGLLIQGSVQPPPIGLRRVDWQRAMGEVAQTSWGVTWTEWRPDPALASRAAVLAREKYSRPAHNQKR
jgi:lipoyl(octanoyl) transferase